MRLSRINTILVSLLASGSTSHAAASLPCSGNVASFASVLSAWPAAQTYCTTKFPVPAKTNTVAGAVTTVSKTVATSTATSTVGAVATVTAQAVTISSTVATQTVTSTTSITTETVNSVTTTTVIEPSFSTVTATEVASSTEVITSISTDTSTVTSTITSTPYSYVGALTPNKRAVTTTSKSSSTAPKPTASAVHSSLLLQAKTFVGSVCTCIETQRTVVETALPSTSTASQTATITITVTSQSTATITPTSTQSITATSTSNVVGTETVTSYSTASTTSTAVSFTTITATSTNVATVTQIESTQVTSTTTTTSILPTETVVIKGPSCNNPDGNLGSGGCNSYCYCDSRPGGPPGVCDLLLGQDTCGGLCRTDNDCTAGFACSDSSYTRATCGGVVCIPVSECSSSYTFTG